MDVMKTIMDDKIGNRLEALLERRESRQYRLYVYGMVIILLLCLIPFMIAFILREVKEERIFRERLRRLQEEMEFDNQN